MWRSGWFCLLTVAAELKRASAQRVGKRDGHLSGKQFPSEKALRATQLWSSSQGGVHGLGGAPLASGRSNECLWCRSLFSSVGAARQRMREAYEMGPCKVDGGTLRWPHVMTSRDAGCADGLDLTGRTTETHAISCHLPQPAPADGKSTGMLRW